MAQRFRVSAERTLGRVIPWVAITLAALVIGTEASRNPERAVMLVGAVGIGWLALERRLEILVPVAVLVLAWGSSTLPGVSVAFVLKFAAIALVSATILPSLVGADRRHMPIPVAFAGGFLGLILFGLLSIGWSVAPSATAQKAISLLLIWGAAVVAIPLWAKDARDLERLLRTTAIVSTTVVAIGLALALSHIIAGFEGSGRLRGLLNSSNAIGFWMAPLLPPLVVMQARDKPGRKRTLLILLVSAAIISVAFSGSRGGSLACLAGIGAGLFALGAQTGRGARRLFLVLVSAAVVIAIALPLLGFHARSTDTNKEGYFEIATGSGRSTAWSEAIPLINQRPLLGSGLGATPILFPAAQNVVLSGNTILGRTHDSFLETGIDLGWVGMTWLVLLILSGMAAALRVLRRPGPDQLFAAALLAGIVGGTVEGMFESGLLAAGGLLAFPFWMVVAMAHVLLVKQAMEDRAATTSAGRSFQPTA